MTMVAMLDFASIEGVLSMPEAIDLLEKTLGHEARGSTSVSPKFTTEFHGGAMRVLFATDSFWEGVDVRGEALRCVIITRLPFRVPTEPIEQARVEAITERGGNAFAEQTVPQAVIKLKQGFGRLIRARSDRGAVVLLDSRVAHKPYGRIFLQSLPPACQLIAPRQTVYAELRRFFDGRRSV